MLKQATMMILSADKAPIVILTAIIIEYHKEYSTLKNIQEYPGISRYIQEYQRKSKNMKEYIGRW